MKVISAYFPAPALLPLSLAAVERPNILLIMADVKSYVPGEMVVEGLENAEKHDVLSGLKAHIFVLVTDSLLGTRFRAPSHLSHGLRQNRPASIPQMKTHLGKWLASRGD
jgi:hypothetical protein